MIGDNTQGLLRTLIDIAAYVLPPAFCESWTELVCASYKSQAEFGDHKHFFFIIDAIVVFAAMKDPWPFRTISSPQIQVLYNSV